MCICCLSCVSVQGVLYLETGTRTWFLCVYRWLSKAGVSSSSELSSIQKMVGLIFFSLWCCNIESLMSRLALLHVCSMWPELVRIAVDWGRLLSSVLWITGAAGSHRWRLLGGLFRFLSDSEGPQLSLESPFTSNFHRPRPELWTHTDTHMHTHIQLFQTNYGHLGDASTSMWSGWGTFNSLLPSNPHLHPSCDPHWYTHTAPHPFKTKLSWVKLQV